MNLIMPWCLLRIFSKVLRNGMSSNLSHHYPLSPPITHIINTHYPHYPHPLPTLSTTLSPTCTYPSVPIPSSPPACSTSSPPPATSPSPTGPSVSPSPARAVRTSRCPPTPASSPSPPATSPPPKRRGTQWWRHGWRRTTSQEEGTRRGRP